MSTPTDFVSQIYKDMDFPEVSIELLLEGNVLAVTLRPYGGSPPPKRLRFEPVVGFQQDAPDDPEVLEFMIGIDYWADTENGDLSWGIVTSGPAYEFRSPMPFVSYIPERVVD